MRVRSIVIPLAAVLLSAPMVLVAPGAASAGDHSVDPATLNPPIPPDHGSPVCEWEGNRIVCRSTVPQPHDLGTFDSVIDCGSGVSLSQTVHWTLELGVATYNADRNIVRLLYVDSYTGSFSNPANGKSVEWTQRDRTTYAFTTPGDNTTGTATMVEFQQVRGANGTPILTDAGTEVFSLPDYTRLKAAGHHPIDDYFYGGDSTGIAPLCQALS